MKKSVLLANGSDGFCCCKSKEAPRVFGAREVGDLTFSVFARCSKGGIPSAGGQGFLVLKMIFYVWPFGLTKRHVCARVFKQILGRVLMETGPPKWDPYLLFLLGFFLANP